MHTSISRFLIELSVIRERDKQQISRTKRTANAAAQFLTKKYANSIKNLFLQFLVGLLPLAPFTILV